MATNNLVPHNRNDTTCPEAEVEEGDLEAMVMEASFTIYEEAEPSTMRGGNEDNLVAGRGKFWNTTKFVRLFGRTVVLCVGNRSNLLHTCWDRRIQGDQQIQQQRQKCLMW